MNTNYDNLITQLIADDLFGIASYLDFIDRPTLQKNIIASLENIEGIEQRIIARHLNLPPDATHEQKVAAVVERIMHYEKRLGELRTFIPDQVRKLKTWLSHEGLEASQQPDDIPVFITDRILARGMTGLPVPERNTSSYEPRANDIVIEIDESPDFVIPHEFGHAMSADTSKQQYGFRQQETSETATSTYGNVWLDEGCAMIVERATNLPPERQRPVEEIDMYGTWAWMTEIFRQELQLSEQDLLKAYLKPGADREQLEKRVIDHYGCTISELDDLFIGFDSTSKSTILALLRKEPVTLTSVEGDSHEESYRKLARIFPNIELQLQRSTDQ